MTKLVLEARRRTWAAADAARSTQSHGCDATDWIDWHREVARMERIESWTRSGVLGTGLPS